MSHLLIRADGDSQIGIGHVMRCLALAQAWQETGGSAGVALAKVTPGLETRLRSEGLNLHYLTCLPGSGEDAQQTIELARQTGAAWVVIDGYHFDVDYQQALKQANLRLLVVDDYGHAGHYYADLVLNQNIYAEASLYSRRESYTHLLLGTRYALLRREFWPWQGWRREISPVACKVLVTLGGADPNNVTLKIIRALSQCRMDGLEAVVVVGNSNPHGEALQAAVEQSKRAIHLQRNVTDMPQLMTWADVAISSGGNTSWELAFAGLPSLVLVLADNQRKVAEGLDAAGIVINLGDPAALSPANLANALTELANSFERRTTLACRGRELMKGWSHTRVVQQMQIHSLALRPAQIEDSRLIWEWANDPTTRLNSFSTELIPWESHLAWFKAKLADPHHVFFLALDAAGMPVGQARYQLNGEEAVISVSLAPAQQGQGYGSRIIQLASERVLAEKAVRIIHAYIKPGNPASIRAFTKAGFIPEGSPMTPECHPLHFVRRKEAQS